jgi:inorganic phosphate transporter, PiT family
LVLDPTLLIGFGLLATLAFANGANDASKGIATLAGSGVTSYRKAIGWGTIWTVGGGIMALFFSSAMVETFSNGILTNTTGAALVSPALVISVMLGSMGWVLFATKTGLPVSTTHAITGALCGAGLTALGWNGILWSSLVHKVVIPLAFSPLVAVGISFLLSPVIRWSLAGWKGHCICVLPLQKAQLMVEQSGLVRMVPAETELVTIVDAPQCEAPQVLSLRVGADTFHWITSGMTSLARGLNDAPKMAALLVGFGLMSNDRVPHLMLVAFGIVAVSMGLGSFLGGLRVTEVLAEKVTKMDHQEGFSANLTTALLVTVAARFGLPVSTTHVSSGAIIGMGLRKGSGHIHWKTVWEMLLAWIVTLPAAAALSAGIYLFLHTVIG